MIIIFDKRSQEILRYATRPEKFRMKLENRIFPDRDIQPTSGVYPVPDHREQLPGQNLPTYKYADKAKNYSYLEVTDKPTAREIVRDGNPVFTFAAGRPVSVKLSTGKVIEF